jgi:CheY-like chemotaxis protein
MTHRYPLRVLIVDDCPDDAELAIRALQRGAFAPDWLRVETPEALCEALCAPAGWDVIACDSGLPRLDTAHIRALVHAIAPAVPIVLLSGRTAAELQPKLDANIAAFVSKDQLDQLPAMVRAILRLA